MPGRFVRPILALLFVLAALLTGGDHAGATVKPGVGQEPTSGDAPLAEVEHLRTVLKLGTLMDGMTHFIVGGGYVYWAGCASGPLATGAEGQPQEQALQDPEAVNGTYLRRAPLGGGAPVLMLNTSFCEAYSWAVDDTGLYFWSNGSIWRVTHGNPLVWTRILYTAETRGRVAVDGTHLYWIVGTDLWRVPKWQTLDPNDNRSDQSEFVADTDFTARDLMIDGARVYWLDNSGLRSVARDCSEVCTVTTHGPEIGRYLAPSRMRESLSTDNVTPIWVLGSFPDGPYVYSGNTIAGHTCSLLPIGGCFTAPQYTAPNRIDSNAVTRTAWLGGADDDGKYLFFVEYLRNPNANKSVDGRLMKWKLDRTVLDGNPFLTPQIIATKTASYTVEGFPAVDERVYVEDGDVYFRTNRGVSRIRADAAPLRWDMAFQAIEVNQVVQNLLNDVPLIARKPTAVRIYGRKLSGPPLYTVGARLYGFTENETPLPGSPLLPYNGTDDIHVNNVDPNRGSIDDGWLFYLPDSWTVPGKINVRAVIDPGATVSDPNRANNSSPTLTYTFFNKSPVCVIAAPVRTHGSPSNANSLGLQIQTQMLNQLFPVSEVWLFGQQTDIAQTQPRLGLPPWKFVPYALAGDSGHVRVKLSERAILTDDPDACDDANANIHYVGLVSWDTPTPNDKGGTTNGSACRPCGPFAYVTWVKQPSPQQAHQAQFVPPIFVDRIFGTLAHELGHNLDRMHVDCGDPEETDPNYPYNPCLFSDGAEAGFDTRFDRPVLAFSTTAEGTISIGDLMSYAERRWPSDYTYRALFGRTPGAARAAAAQGESQVQNPAQAAFVQAGGVLYLSGMVATTGAAGSLDYAWNYPAALLSQSVLGKLASVAAPSVVGAEISADTWHVVLLNAQGGVLDDRAVIPTPAVDAEPTETLPFMLTVPQVAGVAKLELRKGTTVVASRTVSANAPTISIQSPGGGTFDQSMNVTWTAADANGDSLLFTLQYSRNLGQSWQTFLTSYPNLTGGSQISLALPNISDFPATTTGSLIRVIASDGYNTTAATSAPFTVPNRKPVVTITAPAPGGVLPAGKTVTLAGSAMDVEEGGLSGAALKWTLNGEPATAGQSVNVGALPSGDYTAQLTATDGQGASGSASVSFSVAPLVIPQAATSPVLDGLCHDAAYSAGAQVYLEINQDDYEVPVSLVGDANGLWVCFAGMPQSSGASTGTMVKVRLDTEFRHNSVLESSARIFFLSEAAVVSALRHNGTAYQPWEGAAVGRVSATNFSWSGELFINSSEFGGWNHMVGLVVEQSQVVAADDYYAWPAGMTSDNPSTWGPALLGALPKLDALNPTIAPVGSGGVTLQVTGSGFGSGSTLLWNGSVRATTVVSPTRLTAQIPAADLAAAATATVQVRNLGLAQATSAGLPFTVLNPVPVLTNATLSNGVLQVTGSKFVAGAQIIFNGLPLVPGALTGGSASVTLTPALQALTDGPVVLVVNPGPGGGVSNPFALGAPPVEPGGKKIYLPMIRR